MKCVGSRVWTSDLGELPLPVGRKVRQLAADHSFPLDLVRYDRKAKSIMLGRVPGLGRDPVPELLESLTWWPGGRTRRVAYKDPPVYHRTEQMLGKGDPRIPTLAAATRRLEAQGLLSRPDIGRRSSWARAKRKAMHSSTSKSKEASGRGSTKGSPSPEWAPLVLGAVADEFHLSVADLVGPSRRQRAVRARYAAATVLRACGLTVKETGAALNRDHTLIHYALEGAKERGRKHPPYRAQIDRLLALGQRICSSVPDPGRGRSARRSGSLSAKERLLASLGPLPALKGSGGLSIKMRGLQRRVKKAGYRPYGIGEIDVPGRKVNFTLTNLRGDRLIYVIGSFDRVSITVEVPRPTRANRDRTHWDTDLLHRYESVPLKEAFRVLDRHLAANPGFVRALPDGKAQGRVEEGDP